MRGAVVALEGIPHGPPPGRPRYANLDLIRETRGTSFRDGLPVDAARWRTPLGRRRQLQAVTAAAAPEIGDRSRRSRNRHAEGAVTVTGPAQLDHAAGGHP